MNKYEIGLLIWGILLTLQVIQNMKRIEKMGWDMTRKMDKPREETPPEKFMRERKERLEKDTTS